MTPAEALHALRTTPETFLKHYPINPAGTGGMPGVANVTAYHLKKPLGQSVPSPDGTVRIDKRGHLGASRPGPLNIGTREISSFQFQTHPDHVNGSAATNALVVPMVPYVPAPAPGAPIPAWQVGAMAPYVLDGSGDGLMITGQLTGCCFAWEVRGNDLWCTHVQPVGSSGTVIDDDINANGQFVGGVAGAVTGYGKRSYHTSYANVIGVRRAGTWALFSQQSNDMLKTVQSAWRIFPGPIQRL